MAGRGRGRGRGKGLSFDTEVLGIERGDEVPAPVLEPLPTYPPLQFKPVSLSDTVEQNYILNLKQELRVTFRESGFFISPVLTKKDITRYSDKYQQLTAADQIVWDESLFPRELFAKAVKRTPKTKVKKKALISKKGDDLLSEKLHELEEKETTETDDKEEEKKEGDEEAENEEVLDDEELEEEETDYATSYFDNGENYLDDEDDNLDEVVDY